MNTTPPAAPSLVLYAGFWWRFLAWVLDAMVLGLVYAILVGISGSPLPCAVVAWLYSALMESSRWQATLGKRACNLIVVDEETNSISFGRATGRHFAKYLSILTLGVGFVMAAFTQRKQALHDVVAKTLVLRI